MLLDELYKLAAPGASQDFMGAYRDADNQLQQQYNTQMQQGRTNPVGRTALGALLGGVVAGAPGAMLLGGMGYLGGQNREAKRQANLFDQLQKGRENNLNMVKDLTPLMRGKSARQRIIDAFGYDPGEISEAEGSNLLDFFSAKKEFQDFQNNLPGMAQLGINIGRSAVTGGPAKPMLMNNPDSFMQNQDLPSPPQVSPDGTLQANIAYNRAIKPLPGNPFPGFMNPSLAGTLSGQYQSALSGGVGDGIKAAIAPSQIKQNNASADMSQAHAQLYIEMAKVVGPEAAARIFANMARGNLANRTDPNLRSGGGSGQVPAGIFELLYSLGVVEQEAGKPQGGFWGIGAQPNTQAQQRIQGLIQMIQQAYPGLGGATPQGQPAPAQGGQIIIQGQHGSYAIPQG